MSAYSDDQMNEALARWQSAWDAGRLDEAEGALVAAWDSIADPAANDWSQTLADTLVYFFVQTGQFDKGFAWMPRLRAAYRTDTAPNVYVDMVEAGLYYESGDLDRAFAGFDAIYRQYGKRPFAEDGEKYLTFYLGRA